MNPGTNASVTFDAMSALMTRFATGDGTWATAIPRLSFIRYATPHQPMPAHYPPCFCLITQGSKSIAFGDDRLVYDAARFVVAAVDLPVTGVVLDATPEKPISASCSKSVRRNWRLCFSTPRSRLTPMLPGGGVCSSARRRPRSSMPSGG